ncbi:MAG: hypothetical protein IPK17_15700 [Chloroflexi bacterium]|uniref:hypothetical protein n=1 Tax=Candidatus Flexifilum breve TaxID=3140694 RepID=UPI003135CBA8|nr:hypothetical protein [Chloroflexota bacterium]
MNLQANYNYRAAKPIVPRNSEQPTVYISFSNHVEYVEGYSFHLPNVLGSQITGLTYTAFYRDAVLPYSLENLTRAAIEQFSSNPKVAAIYAAIDNSSVQFYVFTSNEVYDDELLDSLIEIESRLMDMFPNIDQSFRFVASILVTAHREVTGNDAFMLFQR